jgi:hypothetical protein
MKAAGMQSMGGQDINSAPLFLTCNLPPPPNTHHHANMHLCAISERIDVGLEVFSHLVENI